MKLNNSQLCATAIQHITQIAIKQIAIKSIDGKKRFFLRQSKSGDRIVLIKRIGCGSTFILPKYSRDRARYAASEGAHLDRET